MNRPLQEHIQFLQRRVERLTRRSMRNRRTRDQLNRMEIEIRAATLAMDYYEKAIALEKQVRAR